MTETTYHFLKTRKTTIGYIMNSNYMYFASVLYNVSVKYVDLYSCIIILCQSTV